MNFFFDNTFPPRLARAMGVLVVGDHSAVHLKDIWKDDPGDEVWIPELPKRGEFTIVSGDRDIMTNPHRRALLLGTKQVSVFMPHGFPREKLWPQTTKFVKWWPAIVAATSRAKPGQWFTVTAQGKVEIWRSC